MGYGELRKAVKLNRPSDLQSEGLPAILKEHHLERYYAVLVFVLRDFAVNEANPDLIIRTIHFQ